MVIHKRQVMCTQSMITENSQLFCYGTYFAVPLARRVILLSNFVIRRPAVARFLSCAVIGCEQMEQSRHTCMNRGMRTTSVDMNGG